jgi:hypothetical protein
MTDLTPETLSTIAKAVRNWRLVRLNRSWLDEHARRLDGCASAWAADLARVEALKGERDDAVALIRAAGGTWAGPDAALAAEEKPDGWILSDGHRAGHG